MWISLYAGPPLHFQPRPSLFLLLLLLLNSSRHVHPRRLQFDARYDVSDDYVQATDIRCGHPKYARVPCFDNLVKKKLVVQAGETAVLECIIYNAKMKAVTWDKKGVGPIAISDAIFIRDNRYSIRRSRVSDWALVIHSVRPEDSGTYRCQINLSKLKEKVFSLKVEAPAVKPPRYQPNREASPRFSTDEFLKDQGLKGNDVKTVPTPSSSVSIRGRDVIYTGEGMKLTCTANYRGVMPSDATLEWYHFGIQKRSDPTVNLRIRQQIVNSTTLTSTLDLKPVSAGSAGPWACLKRPNEADEREISFINIAVVKPAFRAKAASKVDDDRSDGSQASLHSLLLGVLVAGVLVLVRGIDVRGIVL